MPEWRMRGGAFADYCLFPRQTAKLIFASGDTANGWVVVIAERFAVSRQGAAITASSPMSGGEHARTDPRRERANIVIAALGL